MWFVRGVSFSSLSMVGNKVWGLGFSFLTSFQNCCMSICLCELSVLISFHQCLLWSLFLSVYCVLMFFWIVLISFSMVGLCLYLALVSLFRADFFCWMRVDIGCFLSIRLLWVRILVCFVCFGACDTQVFVAVCIVVVI